MWDEIADMPGEIFDLQDVILDLEDFLDSIDIDDRDLMPPDMQEDIEKDDPLLDWFTQLSNTNWAAASLCQLREWHNPPCGSPESVQY